MAPLNFCLKGFCTYLQVDAKIPGIKLSVQPAYHGCDTGTTLDMF